MHSYNLYTRVPWARTKRELAESFRKWGVSRWEIMPDRDPGVRYELRDVALRFQADGAPEVVLSMNAQQRAMDNLRVLYLAIEAMRLNEKRGIADTVREAYLQLAAPAGRRDPYEVLGVRPDTPLEDCEAMFRFKAKRLHPDTGGSTEAMAELNEAIERIRVNIRQEA